MTPTSMCAIRSLSPLASLALLATLAVASPAAAAQPDTEAGLKAAVETILAAGKAGDVARVEALARAMVLPEPEAWFRRVFGPERAPKLATEYARLIASLEQELEALLAQAIKQSRTTVRVKAFLSADDPDANGNQKRALRAMKTRVPLYSARLMRAKDRLHGIHFYSFVHVGGAFRFVGKMRALGE